MGDTAVALFQHSARFITLFDSLDGGFSSKAKTHPAARAGPRGRKDGNERPGAAERTASRRGERTCQRKRLAGLRRRQRCAPHGRVGSGRLVPAAGGRGGRGAPASGLGWGGGGRDRLRQPRGGTGMSAAHSLCRWAGRLLVAVSRVGRVADLLRTCQRPPATLQALLISGNARPWFSAMKQKRTDSL